MRGFMPEVGLELYPEKWIEFCQKETGEGADGQEEQFDYCIGFY